MGNSENGNSPKSEKSSSPATLTSQTNPTNIHMYPDWAAIQAHYGSSVAIPPYYNFPLASGHAPHHYVWGTQQPIMAPYRTSYAAVYAHGNIYAHPIIPFITAAPLSMETPANSKENPDRGLMKKLKSFDGLVMSLGNCGTESGEGGAEDTTSQSVETGGSSNASDGHLATANKKRRKGSLQGTPTTGTCEKTETQANPCSERKVKLENGCDSLSNPVVEPVVLPAISKALELTSHSGINFEATPTNGQQAYAAVLSEPCSQNEKEVKRERRKQSNRESARRSRLRKQAEAEELGRKVEFLSAENQSIKSEISQLAEKSEKLKLQNASLVGRLNKTQSGGREELLVENERVRLVCTENLLSRISSSDSVVKEEYSKNSHQVLDSSLRTDAVAAS